MSGVLVLLAMPLLPLIVIELYYQRNKDRMIGRLDLALVYILLGVLVFAFLFPVLRFTTGLFLDKGRGEIKGTVVSVSYEGILYKTYEVVLRTGDTAASTNVSLSTPQKEIGEVLQKNVGVPVTIHYSINTLTPFRMGNDDKIVISVKTPDDRVTETKSVEELLSR